MYHKIVFVYFLIAFVIFIFLVLFGKVFKTISLGKGVPMGILNSFLLSALWPITLLCSIGGLVCECIETWKKL